MTQRTPRGSTLGCVDRSTIAQLLEETRLAHLRGEDEHIAETTYAGERWIQIVPFVLNLDYPLNSNPKKLLKKLDPPPSVALASFKRKTFVTFAYVDSDTAELTEFIIRYIDATSG